MKTNLYIPKTITVGFQTRTDTFTGKLGYVIYTDHKGVLRKEASWNSWRDRNIESITLDNVPTPNFTLNKGVKRDGHWGSGRSVIRVWDPRDFEFEISVDNLIGILMHADVSKRDITESCVFAWNGTELILLPTNSVEYQQSVTHTEKQGLKFSSKDLKVGYSYSVRKTNDSVVYLGLMDRYESERVYSDGYYYRHSQTTHKKKNKKGHVFIDPMSKIVFCKDPTAFISNVEAEEVHPNFAELMDAYYATLESQPVVGVQVLTTGNPYDRLWCALSDTEFVELREESLHGNKKTVKFSRCARFNPATSVLDFSHQTGMYSASHAVVELPGLKSTSERVTTLVNTVAAAYEVAMSGVSPLSNEWSVIREMQKAARSAVVSQHMLGELHYVMADGKISDTYIA